VSGGSSVTSFSPSIGSSTTYYAQARNSITGCVSATRLPVTGTVNEVPAAPTSPSSNPRCDAGTVTFSATVPGGQTIDWYTTPDGTVLVSDGSSVTSFSPSISSSTTYYAQARNVITGCISATRTPVTGTVNEVPAAPTMDGEGTYCTGSANITATAGANGILWDDGNTSSSRNVTLSGTYYAVAVSAAGCTSSTATVTVTVGTPGGNNQSAIPCGCINGTIQCGDVCKTNTNYTLDNGPCAGCNAAYKNLYNACGVLIGTNGKYSNWTSCTADCPEPTYSASCREYGQTYYHYDDEADCETTCRSFYGIGFTHYYYWFNGGNCTCYLCGLISDI
jgi:hypothetical protein